MKFLITLSLFFLTYGSYGQVHTIAENREGQSAAHTKHFVKPRKVVKKENYQSIIHQLRQRSQNKYFHPKTLEPGLIALAYYPELQNVRIKYKSKNIKTTLAARPQFWSLFRAREKRSYTIFVDRQIVAQEGVLFESFPFNAQVGGLGHEYAHIIDYTQRSSVNILWLGIRYLLSKRAKAGLEQKVDKITIERGLGWQALAWHQYITKHSNASPDYIAYKKKLYLSSEEIVDHMQQCTVYPHFD